MKKSISILVIGAILASIAISCKKESKDNTGLIAGALLLLNSRSSSSRISNTTGTTTQQRQVSTARGGATGAASAARGASGRTASLEFKIKENAQKLMAFNIQRAQGKKVELKEIFAKNAKNPKSILTATLSTVTGCVDQSGAACDGTDSSMTFNQTVSCDNGGTFTANNFRVGLSGTTQDALTLTLSGGLSFLACKASTLDFQNYPNTITSTTTSGAISVAGTYSYSDTITGTSYVFDEKNDLTINSTTDMVFTAGTTAVKIENLISKAAIKTSFNLDNIEYLSQTGASLCKGTACNTVNFANVFGSKSVYVLDGSLVVTGKVGGADAGTSINLSNRTINYTSQCSKSLITLTEADYAEGSTVCTYTIQ